VLSPNAKELYISCWGCDKVYVFDTEKRNIKAEIPVGDNPNEMVLTAWSHQVYSNTPYSKGKEMLTQAEEGNPIPHKVGEKSPIKYVFYVIKENRTYDQVLGDMKEGNGDQSLVLFGEHITPNQHALAKEFVLLDNFYVDAHRSTAYVAGGFVKRNFVDHTIYSTSSMLRTIELILGIPPMSQYDAAVTPTWRSFASTADSKGFTARPANINLSEKNTAMNEWQRRSEKFDLAKEDAVPDLEFNKVLWHGLKGDHVPFPAPRRAAFFKQTKMADRD
jgi:hypothetical protein